jgi:hypothetical protein
MKRIAIVLVLVLLAVGAQAQTVYDMRTDTVAENTPVQVSNLIVTGFYSNGVFVSEAPYGEYNSIWVYMGSGAPAYPAQGDVIQVQGVFKIYNGLYEIDTSAGQWAGQGTAPLPAPLVVPAAVLTDPVTAAPYMCSLITVPDMLYSTAEAGFGEWFAATADGDQVMFDNFWADYPVDELGAFLPDACFLSATGCLNYSFGNFKLAAFEDGLPACPVSSEEASFGSVKSLFR